MSDRWSALAADLACSTGAAITIHNLNASLFHLLGIVFPHAHSSLTGVSHHHPLPLLHSPFLVALLLIEIVSKSSLARSSTRRARHLILALQVLQWTRGTYAHTCLIDVHRSSPMVQIFHWYGNFGNVGYMLARVLFYFLIFFASFCGLVGAGIFMGFG